jgi:hypothetical protein
MDYETALAQGLNRIVPVKEDDKSWAERQLAGLMEEFNLSREEALEIAKTHAPTIYRWVQG